jgi:hypothetical protein
MRLKALLVLLASASAFAFIAAATPRANHDPGSVELVTEDLPRFWAAWDEAARAETRDGRVDAFQRLYLDTATPGLASFTRLRIENASELVTSIDDHPRYYASLRERSRSLQAQTPAIRATFRRMQALYPDAVFPDVYFVIGRMNSGGTLDSTGLLIGVEMFGRGEDVPLDELGEWHRAVIGEFDNLPNIVAHEWVHFQQRYEVDGQPTLLQAAIGEGVADFIAELGAGEHINQHVHAWAELREAELWHEFEQIMHGHDYAGWLYDPAPANGRPADLGYWMGYRIARAYYDRAADKHAAVREMLTIEDFDAFLQASGVAGEFERAEPAVAAGI